MNREEEDSLIKLLNFSRPGNWVIKNNTKGCQRLIGNIGVSLVMMPFHNLRAHVWGREYSTKIFKPNFVHWK